MFLFAVETICIYLALILNPLSEVSQPLIKISVGSLYVTLIPVFLKQTVFRKTKVKEKNIITYILFSITVASATLISIPYYVKWWGLVEEDYNTFVTVYSALIGGGLTLIGVIWTIRRQDIIRIDDEKKKYRPIITVSTIYDDSVKCIPLTKPQDTFISYEATESLNCETYICPIIVRNTDFTPFYVYGIVVDDAYMLSEMKIYVDRNGYFIVSCEQQIIYTKSNVKSVALLAQDLLGNFYKIPLKFSSKYSNTIERAYFKSRSVPITLNKEVLQILCEDEMPAIELQEFYIA